MLNFGGQLIAFNCVGFEIKQPKFAGHQNHQIGHSLNDYKFTGQTCFRRLAEECCRLGLIGTQGSDYHGARLKPWVPQPGVVPPGAPDPIAIVDQLAARR